MSLPELTKFKTYNIYDTTTANLSCLSVSKDTTSNTTAVHITLSYDNPKMDLSTCEYLDTTSDISKLTNTDLFNLTNASQIFLYSNTRDDYEYQKYGFNYHSTVDNYFIYFRDLV